MIPAKKIWFVAAGTGGHIFPGLTLADELKKQAPEVECLFFGTRERLEATLVPRHGYPIEFLRAQPWKGKGLGARAAAMLALTGGFSQIAAKLMHERPRCLVSVGGYVSVPAALACRIFGVPLFILEPNIRAGMANRWLSRFARAAFCAPGADALQLFRCPTFALGNPVRAEIAPHVLAATVKKILVLGGSQGARALCEVAVAAMKELHAQDPTLEMTLQTGSANEATTQAAVQAAGLGPQILVTPFITDIAQALASHDVVIGRAGAMTLAELSIAGLPTLLVPFPFAADDHQRYNARILAEAGAVLMADEKELGFENKVSQSLASLISGPAAAARRRSLSENFKKWGRPHAANEIATKILHTLNAP